MIALLRDIEAGAYVVAALEATDCARIRELMDSYADVDLSFVDASVIALTEHLREPKIATLDHRHFSAVRPSHVKALQLLPT